MKNLSLNSIILNLYTIFVQTRRILFSGKFLYVVGFALAWMALFIVIIHVDDEPFSPNEIFYVLNLVPMIIVSLYVSMMLVTFEKDNSTIETLFSVPGSPYKVWSYKLVTKFVILLFLQLLLTLISFILVADFQFFTMILHVFVPIFFIANFTFFLSVVFRNGYAAGLVTLIILFIVFTLSDPLEYSAWFLYLSPFNKPHDLDEVIWNNRLLYNKASIFTLGFFFMYFGLRKIRNREPFID